MDNNLIELLTVYKDEDVPPIILLENSKREVVGALYLNRLNLGDIVICTNNNKSILDKYYIYSKAGISVYFTYHRKIAGPKVD